MQRHPRSRAARAALLALCLAAGTIMPTAGAAGQTRLPDVANPGALGRLTPSEQGALARNGFVVTAPAPRRDTRNLNFTLEWGNADPSHAVYWQFYDLYGENYALNIPNFITTDALLHTFHVVYDQTLVALERAVLAPTLKEFSQGLMRAAAAQNAGAPDAALGAAARLNLAASAVAARLLDPRAAVPAGVAPVVGRELALIAAHQGWAASPLLGESIDYRRFSPRGHYVDDTTLQRYYRAMTWFSAWNLHMFGPASATHTRQALLLVSSLAASPSLYRLWMRIFDPISAWVGHGDGPTVRDYMALLARVYGAHPSLDALAGAARLRRFMTLAGALPAGKAQAAGELHLFGQRVVPDAQIMQALVWPHAGTTRLPRRWPTGLDVAATLGSSQAAALLLGPLRQNRYANYETQVSREQRRYRTLPDSAWSQSLYWGWLNTLRAVWGPVAPAAPAFMKTQVWADKSLAAGLAAWTELRHETVLYVKLPTGFGGGGGAGGPVPSVAYVEPAPLVYQRLLDLTAALKAALLKEDVLDTLPTPGYSLDTNVPGNLLPAPRHEHGYRAALDGFAGLVALMQRVSEQELLGQAVSPGDMQTLINISNPLAVLTGFFQDNGTPSIQFPIDKQVAGVADVYAAPDGQVLQEGVGDVLPLYAVVSINGRRWLTRGGAFSSYELQRSSRTRLSDDTWRRLPQRPALPAWTASYIRY